jgi:hypothetical protein
MFQSFRQSMSCLHTWFGLVLGYVLMVAFFFGSLSVFDREIDRWAVPQTRFAPQLMPSFDRVLQPLFRQIVPDAHELDEARARVGTLPAALPLMNWGAYTTHRDPVTLLFAEFAVPNANDPDDHVHGRLTIDPRTGAALPHDALKLGSEFFYPMHYSLHLGWKNIGTWVVGFAAMVMLATLVSGVVLHRRILRELFTFRPHKRAQRSALDLHNLTGAVALPFHFIFALSRLTIFGGIYLPVSETLLQPLALAHAQAEAQGRGLAFKPLGRPGALASVDAMVGEAKRRWAARGMLYLLEGLSAACASPPACCSSWRSASVSMRDKGSCWRAGSMRWPLPRSPGCWWPRRRCWWPTACCPKGWHRVPTGRRARSGVHGRWRCCMPPGAARRC